MMQVAPPGGQIFNLFNKVYIDLLGLFQITIERLKCSKAISGWMDGMDGMEISVGTDSKSTALRC